MIGAFSVGHWSLAIGDNAINGENLESITIKYSPGERSFNLLRSLGYDAAFIRVNFTPSRSSETILMVIGFRRVVPQIALNPFQERHAAVAASQQEARLATAFAESLAHWSGTRLRGGW